MTGQKISSILKKLDEEYGTTKEGFLHTHDWQLLTAIMLSAQNAENMGIHSYAGNAVSIR